MSWQAVGRGRMVRIRFSERRLLFDEPMLNATGPQGRERGLKRETESPGDTSLEK